jgi:hypothetical protein
MYEPPGSVWIPHPEPGIKRRENGAGCVLDEPKSLGYLGGEERWGRGGEGMRKGIPAANHDPAVDRMRSTGLVQVSGGAGESES